MPDAQLRPINPPERCEECGWQAAHVTSVNAEATLKDLGPQYRAALTRLPTDPDDLLRRRPAAGVWSALEYAAHVRDVIAVWSAALHKLLTEDHPVLPRPDPSIADEAAAAGTYNTLDPSLTADELAANANRTARKVTTVGANQWDQVIALGDEELSAIGIVRKVSHEGAHHLLDLSRSLGASRNM